MGPNRKELLLATIVFLALPVLVEIALRCSRMEFEPQLYEPDRTRGWVLREGVSGIVSAENRQFVRINQQGFRDQERAQDKPPDTVRIAVLGNSWTEALQVPLDKTYCSVLERLLTKSGCFAGKKVEVLNFGVAGYSTGQELLTLQGEVWKYHPDVVVVAFYPGRDVANNVRELNNAAEPEQSPYFVYHDGQLVLDDSFREIPALQPRQIQLQTIRYRMNDHARILQAIGALQRFVRLRAATAAVKERAEQAGVESPEYAIYSPPSQPALQQAWKVTEGLLLAMREEARAHGAAFRIVVLATRPQVLPDPAKRQEVLRKLGLANLAYADDRITAFGLRERIPVTVLAPALSKYAEEHGVYLNGFNSSNLGAGHWNETGHRVVAETLATELCKAPEDRAAERVR